MLNKGMHSLPRWLSLISLFWLLPLSLFAAPQQVENEPTSLLYPPFLHTPFGIHRGTPDLLKMFVGNRTQLDQPQDLTCNLLLANLGEQKKGPEFQISILGANTGQKHLIYNPDLKHIDVIGDKKNSPQQFEQPTGVAMHQNGNAYVTDPLKKQVILLTFKDNRLQPSGLLPPPPQGWKMPWGIALDSQGKLYITDKQRNQILIYSANHTFLKSIGPILSDGTKLTAPSAISVVDPHEQWSFYKNGFIFFIDQAGQRISRTDLEGNLHRQYLAASLDLPDKKSRFAWLELDYYDNVWVTDPSRCQIHKFNHQLDYLVSYGNPGKGDGFFQAPTGIAIHRHFGQVFVAEKNAAHYFWIGTDIQNAQAKRNPKNPDRIKIQFFLTEPAWVTIKKKSSLAKKDILFKKKWLNSGRQSHDWQYGGDQKKKTLFLEIQATATYSSSDYKTKRQRITVLPISSAPSP